MEEVFDPEQREKRDRRRFWWIAGGLLALAVATLVYLVLFYDVAPPDDAWLLPKPFPAATGPNSIPELLRDEKPLLEASVADRIKLSDDARKVTVEHLEESRAFLQKHQEALRKFNAFLVANQGILSFPGGEKGMSLGTDYSYLSMLQRSADLAAMQARVLAREGKLRESLEQSLALIRLGRQLSHEGNFLVQWLVAVTIQAIGKSALEFAANLHPLDEPELLLVERTISTTEIPSSDLRFAMEGEYLGFKRAIAGSGPKSYPGFGTVVPGFPWWAVWTFKHNTTLVTMLDMERPIFEACGKDWREALLAARALSEKIRKAEQDKFRRFLSINIGGDILIHMALPPSELVIESSTRMAAWHRQMLLMLAMRRFEVEHKTLPAKLDELCPKYLPTVPLDPYDDQPMRWNPTTKALYSVGKNLKDDGGSFSKPDVSSWNDKDVGMFYWWVSPSK